MNLTTDRKPLTLLFNPFFYVAGGEALGIGLAAILLAGLVGAMGNTHFDGVLDTHTGAHAPLWFFLAEGIIDWLCLAAVLLVLGLVVSKTAFRALDVLGTQALARWPSLLLATLMLPGAIGRFGAQLLGLIRHPEASPAINIPDAIVFCVVVLATIPITCWMVYLMYKAYSVSCNVKGGRGIGTFVVGLIAGEVLSKLCIGLVLVPVLAGTGFKAPGPTALTDVGSSSGQTKRQPGDLAVASGQIVNLLAKEHFAAVVAQFDPTMTKALPEARLRATWQDTVKQFGHYKKQLGMQTAEQAGHSIVVVTCQFEHGALDVKVVYDAQSRVSGLWIVRSGSQ
jgi:hypothetical protein